MKHLLFIAVTLCLALTGCTSISTVNLLEPGRFASNESRFPGQATIYVFRGSGMSGAMWSFPITIDGKAVGSIRREQYLAIPATEGAHWLTVICPALCEIPGFKINMDVRADHSYHLMYEPNVSFGYNTVTTSTNLTQIPKEFADRLMENYKQGQHVGP